MVYKSLPMKYELASSSIEEGEIHETGIPYYKSFLQYYYYPLTTKFIGKNTVPHFMDYKGEGISLKLKKEIKSDYPYISFSLLETGKAFFDNRFLFVMDLKEPVEDHSALVLKEVKEDYKEIKKLDRKASGENRFDKFFQRFFFQREELPAMVEQGTTRVFALEDKVLENLDNKNAHIFFRVALERMHPCTIPAIDSTEKWEEGYITKYAFEEVFYNGASFYEYLDLYQESLIKKHNSEEIRTYSCKNTTFIVFSSTTFKQNDKIRRIYDGVDSHKNTRILFNREGPAIYDIQGQFNENAGFLLNLELPEGDYTINDKKVYKICNEGESIVFKDIVYDDFIKSRW